MVTKIKIEKASPQFLAWIKKNEIEKKEKFKKYFEKIIPKKV